MGWAMPKVTFVTRLRNGQLPNRPRVSYQINRQLSGWSLPPLLIRAFGAHCLLPARKRSSGSLWMTTALGRYCALESA